MNRDLVPVPHADASGPSTRHSLLDARQVASWLGVSRTWVLDHASERRRPFLRSLKLGKSVRFRPSDVEAFLSECERVQSGSKIGVNTSPSNSIQRRMK